MLCYTPIRVKIYEYYSIISISQCACTWTCALFPGAILHRNHAALLISATLGHINASITSISLVVSTHYLHFWSLIIMFQKLKYYFDTCNYITTNYWKSNSRMPGRVSARKLKYFSECISKALHGSMGCPMKSKCMQVSFEIIIWDYMLYSLAFDISLCFCVCVPAFHKYEPYCFTVSQKQFELVFVFDCAHACVVLQCFMQTICTVLLRSCMCVSLRVSC